MYHLPNKQDHISPSKSPSSMSNYGLTFVSAATSATTIDVISLENLRTYQLCVHSCGMALQFRPLTVLTPLCLNVQIACCRCCISSHCSYRHQTAQDNN